MRKLFIVALVLAAVIVAAPLAYWYAPGPAEKPLTVQVPEGATLGKAAALIEEKGALRDAKLFRRLAGWLGSSNPIRAGEFELPAHASAAQVLDILQHGKSLQRLITVPEGTPSILVYEKLMAEPLLTGQIDVPVEGSVLPDSYSFERGESRRAVLKRMQDAMTATLDALWTDRAKTIPVKSKREAIILASIVEKETGKPAERRMVAGVYSNRLKIGMALQADPTVIYPVTRGKPLGRRIRQSELRADNGYNTYARAGLPQGPIANPGRESIAAVLNPEKTKALYFVADGSGGHVFAQTLAEHQANVTKWYAIRRSRGEM